MNGPSTYYQSLKLVKSGNNNAKLEYTTGDKVYKTTISDDEMENLFTNLSSSTNLSLPDTLIKTYGSTLPITCSNKMSNEYTISDLKQTVNKLSNNVRYLTNKRVKKELKPRKKISSRKNKNKTKKSSKSKKNKSKKKN